jgi:hypothetical protein
MSLDMHRNGELTSIGGLLSFLEPLVKEGDPVL